MSDKQSGPNGHPFIFTSESVTEGHPDKVCDFIADSVLDAYVAEDPNAHVACEVLCKSGIVVVAGEITAARTLDHEAIAREAIRTIGYTDPAESFNADGVQVIQHVTRQAAEIGGAVGKGLEQGAGDQGLMFGYATDETPELMPLPIFLAHRLAHRMAEDRHAGRETWLRPDAKTQVSVLYDGGRPVEVKTVLVSTMHAEGQGPGADRLVRPREARPAGARGLAPPRHRVHREPLRQLRRGRPQRRLRRHRPQDHRGHLRRGRPPRRRSLQRQRPLEGGPQRRVLLPLRRARGGEGGASPAAPRSRSPTRSAQAQPVSVKVDTFGTGDPRAAEAHVREVRLPAGGDHRHPGPAAPDLPPDHELRPLRSARPSLGSLSLCHSEGLRLDGS